MTKPYYKKITQVLNYLAQKEGGKINYMKALKLLYLADRLHLREYGRLITEDYLVAMEKGTLGSQARDIAIQNKYLPHVIYQHSKDKLIRLPDFMIEANDSDRDQLSETDVECIEEVYKNLGEKTEFELVKLTHDLPEWKRWQYVIESGEKRVAVVEINDLFKNSDNLVLNKIYSQTPDELILSEELFLESQEHRAHIE